MFLECEYYCMSLVERQIIVIGHFFRNQMIHIKERYLDTIKGKLSVILQDFSSKDCPVTCPNCGLLFSSKEFQ